MMRCRSLGFPIVKISTRFGDIRGQSLKLCKFSSDLAIFLASDFFGNGLTNFATKITKLDIFLITCQTYSKFHGDRSTKLKRVTVRINLRKENNISKT